MLADFAPLHATRPAVNDEQLHKQPAENQTIDLRGSPMRLERLGSVFPLARQRIEYRAWLISVFGCRSSSSDMLEHL